jgi:hypothetical protein
VNREPEYVAVMFKNSVWTSKITQPFTITKINWLILFKGIVAVYNEDHTKLLKYSIADY